MTLGQLVNGKWVKNWTEIDTTGEFQRMSTKFHHQITADGSSGYKAEADRYHLYISLGCPWAHRTAILRQYKRLTKHDSVCRLSIPVISEEGWQFSARRTLYSRYGQQYKISKGNLYFSRS